MHDDRYDPGNRFPASEGDAHAGSRTHPPHCAGGRRRRGPLAGRGRAGARGQHPPPTAVVGPEQHPGLRYWYPVPRDPGVVRTDVCVYGGTSAGVTAAVRAAQAGRSVALVVFGRHLGGLSSAGLGATDTGRIESIGGLSREFYRRLGQHYGRPESFTFEPHVAEQTFDSWIEETEVEVYRDHRLQDVRLAGGRVHSLRAENGKVFVAKMFIDASYEGDLLAAAGVSYTVGREANATYGETLNGVQFRSGHQFQRQVDPYVVPGDSASGLLRASPPTLPAAPARATSGSRRSTSASA